MASYNGLCRTNYFTVTDVTRFKEIMASCKGSDDIEVIDNGLEGEEKKYGFMCDGVILGLPYKFVDDEPVVVCGEDSDAEEDLDCEISEGFLYSALQSILPDGEAIIIQEAGWEKMRYLVGSCLIITNTETKYISVQQQALKIAREMLGNAAYDTQMDY